MLNVDINYDQNDIIFDNSFKELNNKVETDISLQFFQLRIRLEQTIYFAST